MSIMFFNDTAATEIYTLSLHDALPIWDEGARQVYLDQLKELERDRAEGRISAADAQAAHSEIALRLIATDDDRDLVSRSEEHTSELQSRHYLVCRLLLEKKTINFHGRS